MKNSLVALPTNAEKDKEFMLSMIEDLRIEIEKGKVRTLFCGWLDTDKLIHTSECATSFLELMGLLAWMQQKISLVKVDQ